MAEYNSEETEPILWSRDEKINSHFSIYSFCLISASHIKADNITFKNG